MPSLNPAISSARNPAAHSRQHRPGYGVHVRREASQLHLAGMPCSVPAGQLWLDALPHSAYRAAVHGCHVSHRHAVRIWWQPADTPAVCALAAAPIRANARIMHRLMPRSELHIYHGGHLDLVLEAERIAAVVEGFLTAGNGSATGSRS
jgi:hypothetical protein